MKVALAVVGAAQALCILAWAGYHEHVRATAPTLRVPLQPADPFDPLRGRYFRLNPQDGTIRAGEADTPLTRAEVDRFLGDDNSFVGDALVGFCPEDQEGIPVSRVCALRRLDGGPQEAPEKMWSRAGLVVNRGDGQTLVTVNFGFDRFFLPNRIVLPARENEPGWTLELSHRPGQPLLIRRLWFKQQSVLAD